jgi:hypothetical protein
LGSPTERSSAEKLRAVGDDFTRGAVASSPSAQPIEASNPVSRFSTAFQSAMLV